MFSFINPGHYFADVNTIKLSYGGKILIKTND